ncbi:hypothetical protein ACN4EE_13030 [Geminocystis sp. CENA526]|uniref:hypothetical protein n=1 Tax=Geminocystis sp. CENA526 TaxID=1355871 RepID=UPI003D6DF95C
MAECRKYKQVQNFCNYGRKIIESAIVIFFEQECKRIKSNNSNFLNAYNQVKTFYDSNKWELPQIYVEGKNIDIKSSNYLFFEDIYVSIEAIDSILKTNFPASLDILCGTINPNFMLTKSILRTNYFIIKDMHSLRNIEDHGSSISLEERLKKLKPSARKLYYEPEIFDKLTISIKWFMQEIYKRVCQLSNQS